MGCVWIHTSLSFSLAIFISGNMSAAASGMLCWIDDPKVFPIIEVLWIRPIFFFFEDVLPFSLSKTLQMSSVMVADETSRQICSLEAETLRHCEYC